VLQGVVFAFSEPARQSFLPEVLGAEKMVNGVALNQSSIYLTRITGPTAAGLMVAVPWFDVAGLFYAQTILSLVGVMLVLLMPLGISRGSDGADMQTSAPKSHHGKEHGPSAMYALREAFKYVASSRRLSSLMLMGLLFSLLGQSYVFFLPVFAKDVFGNGIDRNAGVLGIMISASGVGAFAASLIVASLGNFQRRGLLQVFSVVAFGLALIVFSVQNNLPFALLSIIVVGFMASFFQILNSTMLLTSTDPRLYGRIVGINTISLGLMPTGTLAIGVAADAVGVITTGLGTLQGIQVALAGAGIVIIAWLMAVITWDRSYTEARETHILAQGQGTNAGSR
jgi:MFS family permease